MCISELLIPRAKHEVCFIDDGEATEISWYDDIMEHIRYSHMGCNYFKELFINLSKTIEELALIFHNSIQHYFDYAKNYGFIYPIHYNFLNAIMHHHVCITQQNIMMTMMMV